MGDRSKIEWTDASWTPIRARRWGLPEGEPDRGIMDGTKTGWHCEHVTDACRFCYAESINRRLGTGLDFKPGHRKDIETFLDETMLLTPLRWKRPRMVFVCSMTDLFADFVSDEMIDRMFAVMAMAPQHTFQVLTKRPKRMRDYIQSKCHKTPQWVEIEGARVLLPYEGGWPTYIWLGTSVHDQASADEFVPLLLDTPAAVRFVSYEPALSYWYPESTPSLQEGINCLYGSPKLDWVIAGGESGPKARFADPAWFRSTRDQCKAANVRFFMKQMSKKAPIPEDLMVREFPVLPIRQAAE